MTAIELALFGFYGIVLTMLVFFGLHKYFLLYLYRKHRDSATPITDSSQALPVVTVQLPVFNEKYVVERLIRAVCDSDYPSELLEIQVLDDSTDETQQIAERIVHDYRAQGFDIKHIRRPERRGFKAGALDYGLKLARGEYIAIFDADFVPDPDFISRTVPHFQDSKIGLVQTRWGHLNREYSLLTRIQSMFLDGHFIIEHIARNRSGGFHHYTSLPILWSSLPFFIMNTMS